MNGDIYNAWRFSFFLNNLFMETESTINLTLEQLAIPLNTKKLESIAMLYLHKGG